jgi:hypothetical protein
MGEALSSRSPDYGTEPELEHPTKLARLTRSFVAIRQRTEQEAH